MTQTDKAAEAVAGMPPRIWAKTHGASADVISGQRGLIGGWNEHPRDGQELYIRADLDRPQDAESLRVDLGPIRELTGEDHSNIVAHLSPELEPRGPLPNANSLMMAVVHQRNEIARLTAALATSRAETAMAFEVASDACADYPRAAPDRDRWEPYDEQIEYSQRCIEALTPAHATAALAARDKAKDDRIAELEAECDRRHAALEQMQAERDAALAGAVKVRPLAWDDHQGRGAKAAAFGRCNYLISQRRDGTYEACESYPGYGGPWIGGVFYPTLEAAKAAAQSDYEARIFASIQPDTEAVDMAEAAAFSAGYEAGQRDEREACAALASVRAGSLDDAIKWGGGKVYLASLKGGLIELRNLAKTIRQRGERGKQ